MGFFLEQAAVDSTVGKGDSAAQLPSRPLFPYLVLGVGASLMVPLFLNMISSTLVPEAIAAERPTDTAFKLLVIAGFALIAAVSSRRFITSLTDKVIQDVQKIKAIAEDVERKTELIVEPENAPSQQSSVSVDRHAPIDASALSETEKRVLRTLFNSAYSARALSGIKRDAELEEVEARQALDNLASMSFLSQTQTFKGFPKWSLTNAGRVSASVV